MIRVSWNEMTCMVCGVERRDLPLGGKGKITLHQWDESKGDHGYLCTEHYEEAQARGEKPIWYDESRDVFRND